MQDLKVLSRYVSTFNELLVVHQPNQVRYLIKFLIYNNYMEQPELKIIFNKHYTDDSSLELVIQKLKDAGASQMECTRTLVFELKISLSKADEIVVNSKAWAENWDVVNKLRNEFIDVANRLEE